MHLPYTEVNHRIRRTSNLLHYRLFYFSLRQNYTRNSLPAYRLKFVLNFTT